MSSINYQEWLASILAAAADAGVVLALHPLEIWEMERAGLYYDFQTGEFRSDQETVTLTVSGEAFSVIVESGFLDD